MNKLQNTSHLEYQQQAANQLRRHNFCGAGEERLGELLGERGGYGNCIVGSHSHNHKSGNETRNARFIKLHSTCLTWHKELLPLQGQSL